MTDFTRLPSPSYVNTALLKIGKICVGVGVKLAVAVEVLVGVRLGLGRLPIGEATIKFSMQTRNEN
jgi:hypothetical protein